ncbi:hypothetical protein KFU94_39135 [Chloroflexi bacterium TSY]|nr:hypothetical protein [Chloroflexi bacterium TSY]
MDPMRHGFFGLGGLLWTQLIGNDDAWNPQPALAESWEVSEDGLRYTFHLRQDAGFSDGTPITANEVAWSLRRQATMGHPKIYAFRGNWAYIKHMGPFIKGVPEITDGDVEIEGEMNPLEVAGIQVIDDYTLVVEHERPYPFFLGELAMVFRIVQPDCVSKGHGKEEDYTADEWWTVEEGCGYSGVFAIESFDGNKGMTLVPNPNHWGPEPKLTKIEVTFANDTGAAMTAFQNDEADVVWMNLGGDDLRSALLDPALEASVLRSPSVSVHQFWITPYPPLDDVHVRRAIAMAIDKEAMLNVLDQGLGIWSTTPSHFNAKVNPVCPEQQASIQALPFDPDKAKAELAMSQYKDTISDMEINISINPWGSISGQTEAEIIQKMLQDNLGLKVTIRPEKITDSTKPPFPPHLWRNEQGDWSPEPSIHTRNMIHILTAREGGYGSEDVIPMVTPPYVPELLALSDKAVAAQSQDEKCALLGEIWQMWAGTVFSLDYGIADMGYLASPRVKNFRLGFGNGLLPYVEPRIWDTYLVEN